jgi:hypothetical protein
MVNLEILQKTDPYTHQRIMNTINTFIQECGAYPSETTALLIRNGFKLDAVTLTEAFKFIDTWAKEEQTIAKNNAKEAELQRIEMNKPDVKYYKLYNARNGDPKLLYEYCAKHDLEELKKYLQQLQDNPAHFHSIFKGKPQEATEFLFRQIAIRQCDKPETPAQTPASTATKPYTT